MNLGKNLQFLRRMRDKMTQEELADYMGVSRQTVSKWELGTVFPEIDKVVALCKLFGCSMDDLVQGNLCIFEEACSNIRVEAVEAFRYMQYAVISPEPEDDAINHVTNWARANGVEDPKVIGWDFPVLSQEQINVYHMHGYAAAWVLPKGMALRNPAVEIMEQKGQRYAAITITDPMKAPFRIIPNAYKTLMAYMQVKDLKHKQDKEIIACFEYSYYVDGVEYMDVYIAVE